MNDIPAYRKVYTQLKHDIKEGSYAPGTLLPTESELEQRFSVSRTTIRKAIELLSSEGFLKKTQGKGTEILDTSTTQRLNHLTSITETLTAKGYHVTTRGMSIELITPPEHVADALKLPAGSQVYLVQRVQYADDRPIALMNNYLRANYVPGLEQHVNRFNSLYAFLEQTYHIILLHAWERLSAVAADFTESQILQVPLGSPLLCSKRISHVEQGPFEYSLIKLVADKYEYSVYLEGRT
ncbi:GntR family transcriptional regulator [Paenibacillus wulumuqiensis]|uniref:GntR family transcriptional regulator n=1 Tax=Paenibacillus wulumuqiensis TaxID=1567107 RepID=UPI0006196C09|nr:GntR family transcriptional regulator [Paenibacillus wulumuqiensis]